MKKKPPSIRGTVIGGLGAATRLGFPTANISRSEYHRVNLKLPLGIYAGIVALPASGKRYKAGIVVGPNKIEAHLIGFQGELYGKRITFTFIERLRAMKRFNNESALKRQIERDLARTQHIIRL